MNHDWWRHGAWENHWHHGWWHNRPLWWTAGLAGGVALAAAPWAWGYWPYSNPYYTAPVVVGDTTIDYSQPILAAAPPATAGVAQLADAPPVNAEEPTPADRATDSFEAARQAFMQGDYPSALTNIDQAIAVTPDDPALHEFRGLALFAMHRYKEAAAVIYAVLSTGPGWDWTTLSSLYPSVDVYTEQFRALESYCTDNPQACDARFLLAYQYLTCGEADAADAEFKEVVRCNPKDQLSAQLESSLQAPDEQQAELEEQPAPVTRPAAPINPASLAGQWQAQRPDGSSISLELGKDSKFSW
ncbi:MAG TPA: tetratricopeptide repeat protein, partial [Pirellulales bacterium]|nr:tetratricopeptide repeat protein [Pirellulales bacterium]